MSRFGGEGVVVGGGLCQRKTRERPARKEAVHQSKHVALACLLGCSAGVSGRSKVYLRCLYPVIEIYLLVFLKKNKNKKDKREEI